MSDTPRTDNLGGIDIYDHARQLESELAKASNTIIELQNHIALGRSWDANDSILFENAELKDRLSVANAKITALSGIIDRAVKNEPKDGGPAFPGHFDPLSETKQPDGMSLRDWFAGMALNGYVSGFLARGGAMRDSQGEYMASCMYEIADSMLEARKEAK